MLYSRHADVWGKAAGPSALGILRERAFRDERRLSARSKAIRASGDPASLEISVASLDQSQVRAVPVSYVLRIPSLVHTTRQGGLTQHRCPCSVWSSLPSLSHCPHHPIFRQSILSSHHHLLNPCSIPLSGRSAWLPAGFEDNETQWDQTKLGLV